MTDDAREQLIQALSAEMESLWAEWERESCFAARGAADAVRARRDALILGRSAEQVARMELARGLSR